MWASGLLQSKLLKILNKKLIKFYMKPPQFEAICQQLLVCMFIIEDMPLNSRKVW